MLPKQHRITSDAQYQFIKKNGKKFFSDSFLFVYVNKHLPKNLEPNSSFSYPLIGFIASKKVGNAVNRNKSKRLLREAIRGEIKNLSPSFCGIFIASKTTPTRELNQIKKEVQKCFALQNFYLSESTPS